MSERENNPVEGPGVYFLLIKLRYVQWQAKAVCHNAFSTLPPSCRRQVEEGDDSDEVEEDDDSDEVEEDDDSLESLGQLLEVRAELKEAMKALVKATDAFALHPRNRKESKIISNEFEKLSDIEKQASVARRGLTSKIWKLCKRHGKIDKLFASPELNPL